MDSKENIQLKCELCGRAYMRYSDLLSVRYNLRGCCRACNDALFFTENKTELLLLRILIFGA